MSIFWEWEIQERKCEFLEPFFEITWCPIHLIPFQTYTLYANLENLLNEGVILKTMTWNIKEKFQKDWNEYSIELVFGTIIIGSQLNVNFIKYYYRKLDLLTYEDKAKKLMEKFMMLFENIQRICIFLVFLFSNNLINPSYISV